MIICKVCRFHVACLVLVSVILIHHWVNVSFLHTLEHNYVLYEREIVKIEDDSIPLPDPFPLPKYFSRDVEKALENKKNCQQGSEDSSCWILLLQCFASSAILLEMTI